MSSPSQALVDALQASGLPYELIECKPDLADTASFCEHYGYSLEDSANAIVIKAKTGERRMAMCVLLATTRLDLGPALRARIGSRRVSFASAQETVEATAMQLGGVTPLGLQHELPIWVDAAVMDRERVILGGGDRFYKVVISPTVFEHITDVTIIDGLARPPDPA